MTESAVIAVIMCICSKMGSLEAKRLCAETYVNCAVVGGNQYLSKQDFIKRCNFADKQESCVIEYGDKK